MDTLSGPRSTVARYSVPMFHLPGLRRVSEKRRSTGERGEKSYIPAYHRTEHIGFQPGKCRTLNVGEENE